MMMEIIKKMEKELLEKFPRAANMTPAQLRADKEINDWTEKRMDELLDPLINPVTKSSTDEDEFNARF